MNPQFTAGPWAWHFNPISGAAYLATPDRGRLIVMDTARKGMQGTTVRFSRWTGLEGGLPRGRQGGIMCPPQELLALLRGQHDGLHPDMQLMRAAPDLFSVVVALSEALDAAQAYIAEPMVRHGIAQRLGEAQAVLEKAAA